MRILLSCFARTYALYGTCGIATACWYPGSSKYNRLGVSRVIQSECPKFVCIVAGMREKHLARSLGANMFAALGMSNGGLRRILGRYIVRKQAETECGGRRTSARASDHSGVVCLDWLAVDYSGKRRIHFPARSGPCTLVPLSTTTYTGT